MAEDITEGGAKNAWQEAVIDNLPPLEALTGVEREVMEYDEVVVGAQRQRRRAGGGLGERGVQDEIAGRSRREIGMVGATGDVDIRLGR